jgi:hypothetical protein
MFQASLALIRILAIRTVVNGDAVTAHSESSARLFVREAQWVVVIACRSMSAFGGKADMTVWGIRFRGRYWGQSGRTLLHCKCPLMTQSGHADIIEVKFIRLQSQPLV